VCWEKDDKQRKHQIVRVPDHPALVVAARLPNSPPSSRTRETRGLLLSEEGVTPLPAKEQSVAQMNQAFSKKEILTCGPVVDVSGEVSVSVSKLE